MALSATSFASALIQKYETAGKLTHLDQAGKDAMKADWEFWIAELFDHFKNNAVVTVEADAGTDGNTRFNQAMAAGIPIPQDGGVGLQATTVAASGTPSTDTSTGGIE